MSNSRREELFKRWFCEHKQLMFKVVRAYAVSPEDQDDLFQEILLQAWSSGDNFEGRARETTWLYRVALNTALVWKRGQLRKRKRHRKLIIDFDRTSDKHQNGCDSGEAAQIVDRLYGAIRKLSKIDSSIVLMYLDGLDYNEMAEILGISKSNIGVKLYRAKKELARLLKGLIDDF